MCIALLSTSHPSYALILASNRDEFISRPTAPASWWAPPHTHVLGGRDLQRSVQGTWLGITRQGRLACLTNFRESSTTGAPVSGLQSRGAIALSYLTVPADSAETPAEAAERIVGASGVQDVGGFSLLFGQVSRPDGEGRRGALGVVSNRTPDARGTVWIAGGAGEVRGLSNAHFGDGSWPKVARGEEGLRGLVEEDVETKGGKGELVERLFALLSVDTLPKREAGQGWETVVAQLRKSIFIPRLSQGADEKSADEIAGGQGTPKVHSAASGAQVEGVYATHQQTVILVDMQGHVTFVEKTLYTGKEQGGDDVRTFEFDIEGW